MHRTAVVAAAVLSLTFAAACGGDRPARPHGEGAGSTSTKKAAPAHPTERQPAGHPSGEAQRVTFPTRDGVTLAATLRPGGAPHGPAVILVHQLSTDRSEWAPVIAKLAEAPGLTILAIDMRGHGESTAGPDGTTLAWRDFSNAEWAAIKLDVLAAADYLANSEELHPSAIAAVGSSIGSTAVIAAAAEDDRITAVVAISPGRAYHGFDAYTPLTHIGQRPFLAIAAEGEAPAIETASAMQHIAPHGELQTYPGSAHGLAILQTSPEMTDRIDRFVRDAVHLPR